LPCPGWICGVINNKNLRLEFPKQSLSFLRTRTECLVVSDLATHNLLDFCTTYLCETAFSKLKVIKYENRSFLKNIENVFRPALSCINIRMTDLRAGFNCRLNRKNAISHHVEESTPAPHWNIFPTLTLGLQHYLLFICFTLFTIVCRFNLSLVKLRRIPGYLKRSLEMQPLRSELQLKSLLIIFHGNISKHSLRLVKPSRAGVTNL